MNETTEERSVYAIAGKGFLRELVKYWWVMLVFLFVFATVVFAFPEADEFLTVFVVVALLMVPGALYVSQFNKAKEEMWGSFASMHGFEFVSRPPSLIENALVFGEGHDKNVRYQVSGARQGRPFRVFEYTFVTGSGKHKTTHQWTIFEIGFTGTFPHLYLNNTKDGRHVSFEKRFFLPEVDLPADVAKDFKLYVPKEYEIEALEIFSHDTLVHLLDTGWRHDLELVGGELIICKPGFFRKRSDLDAEFAMICGFVDHLAPKLDRMRLAKIGDLKETLF